MINNFCPRTRDPSFRQTFQAQLFLAKPRKKPTYTFRKFRSLYKSNPRTPDVPANPNENPTNHPFHRFATFIKRKYLVRVNDKPDHWNSGHGEPKFFNKLAGRPCATLSLSSFIARAHRPYASVYIAISGLVHLRPTGISLPYFCRPQPDPICHRPLSFRRCSAGRRMNGRTDRQPRRFIDATMTPLYGNGPWN